MDPAGLPTSNHPQSQAVQNDGPAVPHGESRWVKRPPLRRTPKFRRIPGFSDDDSDDSDDDSDSIFSSSVVFPLSQHIIGSDDPDSSSDSDEDDDLAQAIRCAPVRVELRPGTASTFGLPSLRPPSPLPLPTSPPCATTEEVDIFSIPPSYHGFSYNALALVRKVWNTRCRQFSHCPTESDPVKPNAHTSYAGLFPPTCSPTRGFFHSTDTPSNDYRQIPPFPRVASSNPNVPIYPRIGDISSLRDDDPAALDRVFCHFPLYTIRKTLYLHDVQQQGQGDTHNLHLPYSDSSTGSDDEQTLVGEEPSCKRVNDNFSANVVSDSMFLPLTARRWQYDWLLRWQTHMDPSSQEYPPSPSLVLDISETQTYPFGEEVDDLADFERLDMYDQPERPTSPKFFFASEEDDEAADDLYVSLPHPPSEGLFSSCHMAAIAT
ncbi:uncharacterized protein FIBRA_08245 [Fibroporia radiculosa]|uniref:Uncharacterized protein n=1 Tax=Fibroporia radiculosa TaxID=599839 RepID=J4I2F1_9APHY|nr:uncharacterized protein FIBRA_08245 [Fibroporia radiculosa]CCM06002.1 predicted protein [Fibroporia radiculosa]